MTRRTGVMGGMFDPVHVGHLQAAAAARSYCQLDEVLLVPCGTPVHRVPALTPSAQRCDMLRIAMKAESWLSLDTRECDSVAPSRTRDTLEALRQDRPNEQLYFILGVDAFLTLSSWYRWREIFGLAHLIVVARPGFELALGAVNPELQQEFVKRAVPADTRQAPEKTGRIFMATVPTPELSSSHVRKLLREGKPVTAYLPPGVAEYIESNHLYR